LVLGWFAAECHAQKGQLNVSIERRDGETWAAARQIWEWAEPGYQEQKSSKLLAELLEKNGFVVARGVAEMPTAFTATYGSGGPVIGILGEYDALPGLSQQAVPERLPARPGGYGHGCGHHLFGVASASAAIAVAEQIRSGQIRGTIRFYGCPAEEGGSAKVFLVLAGLFQDCDAVLHWHPGDRNAAGERSSLARMAVKFRFLGKSAHAAGAPDQGRSALDAVELTNHAAELLREHVPDATRIHHVITYGGAAPNVIPDFAEVYYYVRHPKSDVVRDVYRRLVLCAQAGALATETKLETHFEGGIKEILPNNALSQVTLANLRQLNDLQLTDEDTEFATRLQQTIDKPRSLDSVGEVEQRTGGTGMGSTDVGDVSWVVPTSGFSTACFVPGVPGHSWQAVASGGTNIGRRGMNLAAKVLAATAWDLFSRPEHLAAGKTELQRRLNGTTYSTLMEAGQKPPLDYRNPPVGRGAADGS
jgi:aminobenzoyl-glutamate utilization protein B